MTSLKDSRILITGGAGFVGSSTTDALLREGVGEVVIYDNFSRGLKENLESAVATGKVTIVDGDIRDRDRLNAALTNIDYCLHAATLRITQCAAEPENAFGVMYDGTFNVFKACVDNNVKRVVFSSTASVYGQAESFPTKEDHHPYNNTTLYGASKTAAELVLKSLGKMYGLKYNIPRYFNIYGPRIVKDGKYTEVFARWYQLIKEGKPPVIYGDGKQTMDFVYIDDIARANVLAFKSEVDCEIFNIASGTETSLEELCLLLLETMGSNLKPQFIPLPADRQKVEVQRRLADVSKARGLLGFETQVSLKDGLKRLVSWLDQQQLVKVS